MVTREELECAVDPAAKQAAEQRLVAFFLKKKMRLYRALRGYSCGSRGFRRGPDDGQNHRQGATSSTSRVISLQGQSGARTALVVRTRPPSTIAFGRSAWLTRSGVALPPRADESTRVAYTQHNITDRPIALSRDNGPNWKADDIQGQCTATSTSFLTIIRAFFSSTPHTPCAILYVVTMLIGC